MRVICGACGSIQSLDASDNDTVMRAFVQVLVNLPTPLPPQALQYLGLFRPAKSALTWKKALRLVGEVRDLTVTGYVRKQGCVDRPCPARIWALAMEKMLEQRAGLELPMPNHNYLRKVAYGLADQADAQVEASRREVELSGRRPEILEPEPNDGLLPIEREMQRRGMKLQMKGMD